MRVETGLKAQNSFELLSLMLQLRRAEKDFMLRLDVKYLSKFNKIYDELYPKLQSYGLSPLLLDYFSIDSLIDLSIVGAVSVFLLGLYFLQKALVLLKSKSVIDAKKLMISSLIYLPVLQIIYIIDKFI